MRLLPARASSTSAAARRRRCDAVVERYDAHGVASSISPFTLSAARAADDGAAPRNVATGRVNALDYRGEAPFDAVMALGPGWEHDTFTALIRQVYPHVAPGGMLLLADGFWRGRADGRLPCAARGRRDEMGSHVDNVRAGIELGLTPLWAASASQRDWDRYEWKWLSAVERWADGACGRSTARRLPGARPRRPGPLPGRWPRSAGLRDLPLPRPALNQPEAHPGQRPDPPPAAEAERPISTPPIVR